MLRASVPPAFCLLWLWLPMIALSGVASAQVTGYIGQGGEVLAIDLRSPSEGIPEASRWDLFDTESIYGLERSADGTLYALTINGLGLARLYEVDLGSQTATPLRDLGFLGSPGLALGDDALLWIHDGDDLYSYDIAGDVLTLETTIPSDDVVGIAWRRGELYLLFRQPDEETGPTLGIVDPSTGVVLQSRELPGLVEFPYLYAYGSMDFDDAGGLWIARTKTIGGIIDPPSIEGDVAYFDDPWTDDDPESGSVSQWPDSTVPLAVVGSVPAVDVPGLQGAGMLVLALVLAGCGTAALRRRRLLTFDP